MARWKAAAAATRPRKGHDWRLICLIRRVRHALERGGSADDDDNATRCLGWRRDRRRRAYRNPARRRGRGPAEPQAGRRRDGSGAAQSSARAPGSRHGQSAFDGSRDLAESPLYLRGFAHPSGKRRLDATDHRKRTRRFQEHRRGQHAAQRRRHTGIALAQGSGVGLHAVWFRADQRDRPAGPHFCR